MTQTTHVFLDVDGVFNAFAFDRLYGRPQPTHWSTEPAVYAVKGYQFTVFDEVVKWINETAARDDVQFHWLTTWRTDAATEVGPIVGINGSDWPVLDRDARPLSWQHTTNGGGSDGWWKLAAIREHVNGCADCRFVWIDDDLFDSRARTWASDFETEGRALLIQPDPHLGLSPAHLTMINAFLEEEAEL